MSELAPIDALVLLSLAISVYTDLTRMKIFNAVTLPLWVIGPLYWVLMWALTPDASWHMAIIGVVGIAAMLPIHFFFFAIGIDKGGDAKLMIAVGACLGWWIGLESTIWAIVLMGPVGAAIAIAKGRGANVLATARSLFVDPVRGMMGLPKGDKPEPLWVPKAPVIAAAVILARLTPWLEAVLLNETTSAWVP
ncbi:MAG: prepilin peptidase [Myxococcota bacterium]